MKRSIHRAIAVTLLLLSLWTLISHASNPNTSDINLMKLSLEELMEIRIDNIYIDTKNSQTNKQLLSANKTHIGAEFEICDYNKFIDMLNNGNSFCITYNPIYYYIVIKDIGRPVDYNNRILIYRDSNNLNENIFKNLESND